MLRTQDIPGKGVGVIATRQISVGTLVLSERPIIQVASSTYQANLAHLVLAQLQKLDSHDREGFLALRNTHEQMLPIEGIFKTNAIPLGRGSSAGGIFLQCSRFNHSCTANAAYHWDANQKRERVFAIREINPEEEIVVSYLSEDVWALPTKERKARILQEFGFQCRCARCENNDPNEQLQSDQRRTRFGEIYRTIGDGMLIMLNPSKAPTLCREALHLLQEEGEIVFSPFRDNLSPTTHSKSASVTVMSRAQKSLHLWRWMRNVCGMELTAVSCHRRRSWHSGRNHTVSHFKRRNGLLRVAAAVAASLQNLPTRMNGSGAERAEKGKKKERKKILECQNGVFLSNSGYR